VINKMGKFVENTKFGKMVHSENLIRRFHPNKTGRAVHWGCKVAGAALIGGALATVGYIADSCGLGDAALSAMDSFTGIDYDGSLAGFGAKLGAAYGFLRSGLLVRDIEHEGSTHRMYDANLGGLVSLADRLPVDSELDKHKELTRIGLSMKCGKRT